MKSKLNTKLENYTRGQNKRRNWVTIHEVKTKYEAGKLYTRSKLYETVTIHEVKTKYEAGKLYTRSNLNTKLGNNTRGQN